MVRLRPRKVARIASDIPELEVDGEGGEPLLVLSWGGTYGPVAAAVRRVRAGGGRVAHAHLRYLNPFPRNTAAVLSGYEKILVPEMNLGQLALLLRAKYLVDVQRYSRVRGLPISLSELARGLETEIDECEGVRA